MMKQSPTPKTAAPAVIPVPDPPKRGAPRISPMNLDDYPPAVQLAQADELLPRCGECEEPYSQLIRAILACVGLLQRAERDWNGQARDMAAGFAVGKPRVHPSLDMGGDWSATQTAQEKEMVRKAMIAMRSRAGDKYGAEAAKLGQEAATRAQAAEHALRVMMLEATSYETLKADTKFSAKFNRDALEKECRGRGLDDFERQYKSFFELGMDERCAQLELAAEPWLREELTQHKAATAAFRERMTGRGAGQDVFQQVRLLLSLFDQRRKRQLDESITIAPQVLRRLIQPAFIAIVGLDAWSIDRHRMSAIIESGSLLGDWELSDNWVVRSLPTNV